MALQNDYRPWDFDEVVGNTGTVDALASYLEREDKSRVLMFTGPTGCGKTTLARITAKVLGAYDPEAKGGDSPDYTELNGADFRGVDTARAIRSQMMFKPMAGDYRVWLLDECHQLTNDAQEALLKALEEPPPHVVFLLATTNPEKLKATFRRRCTPFEVGPVDDEELVTFLQTIVTSEDKKVDDRVLSGIARDSLGSPGMALMILDKVIGLPPAKMAAAAKEFAEKENQTIELCRALLKREAWGSVARVLKGLHKEDQERIRRGVLGYCEKVLLGGDNADAYCVMAAMREPFYNTGWPGLVLACYEAVMPD